MSNEIKHSTKCILRSLCAQADSDACNRLCPAYIGVHGINGDSGRVGNANIPSDYRLLTLATSPARDSQPQAYRTVAAYVATFTRMFTDERIKSVYLYSRASGTGKTTTACAIANEYLVRNFIGSIQRGITPLERPAYVLDVNAWQTLYNGFNRSNIPQDVAEVQAREYYRQEALVKSAPFAVLDDIGVRSATEAFRADLHGVINHRVTNAMPTCYTSNVSMSELAGVFDGRLADRVRDMTVEIAFVGDSKRGMRLTGGVRK